MATARKSSPIPKASSPIPVKPARKAAVKKAPVKVAAQPAKAAGELPKAVMPKAGAKPAPKADKPKKPKLVRDSFTIPKTEYAVLEDLKQRAAKAGTTAKKSEVLRAGIKALAAMNDAAFVTAMAAVPAIKTGRPAKG